MQPRMAGDSKDDRGLLVRQEMMRWSGKKSKTNQTKGAVKNVEKKMALFEW